MTYIERLIILRHYDANYALYNAHLPMWGPWSMLHFDTAYTWWIVELDCHIDRILLVTTLARKYTAPHSDLEYSTVVNLKN